MLFSHCLFVCNSVTANWYHDSNGNPLLCSEDDNKFVASASELAFCNSANMLYISLVFVEFNVYTVCMCCYLRFLSFLSCNIAYVTAIIFYSDIVIHFIHIRSIVSPAITVRPERQIALTSKLKTWVRPVWRRTSLFYVTILATLCNKGLRQSFT